MRISASGGFKEGKISAHDRLFCCKAGENRGLKVRKDFKS